MAEFADFWESFYNNFNYSQSFLSEICWEEVAEEILYIFFFIFCFFSRCLSQRLKSTPNGRFFLRNFTSQFFYLPSEFLSEICWWKKSLTKYFFNFFVLLDLSKLGFELYPQYNKESQRFQKVLVFIETLNQI